MKKILLPLLLLAFMFSCDENSNDLSDEDNFNRRAMLENIADNIILPAYEDFDSEIKKIKASEEVFVGNPTEANLVALRDDWLNAYKKWQWVAMYELGKAEELLFRDFMNSYPTTVNTITVNGSEIKGISQNIASESYNLELPSNRSVQGFPALDYLLNGLGDNNAEVLAFYATDKDAGKYKSYLSDVVARMESLSAQVLASWKSTYRDEFVTRDGSTATSSTDILVNKYIFQYENRIRNLKVAIPSGIRSNQVLFDDKVEAFYKGDLSQILLLESVQASQDFFNGKAYEGDAEGASFKTYLQELRSINGGEDLVSVINTNYNNAKAEISKMDNSLARQINTDNDKMVATYDALQKNVNRFKIELIAEFDVAISFADADGD